MKRGILMKKTINPIVKTVIIIMSIFLLSGLAFVSYFYIQKGKAYLNSIDFALNKITNINANISLADQSYNGVSQVMRVAPRGSRENKPNFTDAELKKQAGLVLSPLDTLGRVGTATVTLSKATLPKKPQVANNWQATGDSGSQELQHNYLISPMLYNSAKDQRNQVTTTKSLQKPYKVKFEKGIKDYLERTNHHVVYRVTPIFKDNELLARGLQIEAQSVEDQQIKFNVYILNIQGDQQIDYITGSVTKNGDQGANAA